MVAEGLRLSFSKINAFSDCSLKYKFRYVDRLRKPKAIQLHQGIIFHQALEKINKYRMVGFPYPVFPNGTADSLVHDIQSWWSEVPETELARKPVEGFIWETTLMVWKFIHYEAPYDLQGSPETELKRVLYDPRTGAEDKSVTITGVLDALGVFPGRSDSLAPSKVVIDYKTAKQGWQQGKADRDFQAAMYSYLLGEDVTFVYEVFTKPDTKLDTSTWPSYETNPIGWLMRMGNINWRKLAQKVKHQTFIVEVGHEDRVRVYNWIQAFLRADEARAYSPSYSFGCWNRCEYAEECDEWGRT